MSLTFRPLPVLAIGFLLVAGAGCERGCAKPWLADRGIGADPRTSPSVIVPLGALDCPDGLARCRDGVVEASILGTAPAPCTGEACACPWERVATCARGCTANGVEVVIERDQAEGQLCAPATVPPSHPADATTPLIACEIRGYVCEGAVVEQCDDDGATPRAVAVCTHRCVAGIIDADGVTTDQAIAILCARR